jgi:uncharacterized membrane protein
VVDIQSIRAVVDKITSEKMNVGEKERWLSVLGGGALVLYGLRKRSWPSLALALLGGAFAYRGITGHCPAYEALEINRAKKEGEREPVGAELPETGWVKIEKSILIRKDPTALYSFLQNVENLPRVLDHIESVRGKNDHHSHWIAKAAKGMELEWEAETIEEKLNEQITWRAIEEGGIDNLFSFHLEDAPAGDGTRVRFSLQYNREQRLFGDPEKLLAGALDRLKEIIETEEAPSEAAA